jgi:hypothetical protein
MGRARAWHRFLDAFNQKMERLLPMRRAREMVKGTGGAEMDVQA